MATQHKIYINEAPFTADESTIDKVIAALEVAGFTYDETTEGFIEPGYYEPTEVQQGLIPIPAEYAEA